MRESTESLVDHELEPKSFEVDAERGLRVHVMQGYWVTLGFRAARTLALRMLETWPDKAPRQQVGVRGEFRRCKFCGCNTNAFERACCELGRAEDAERLTDEQMARWEEEAEFWMVRPSGVRAEPVTDSRHSPLVRMLAGRLLLALDEIVRLRRRYENWLVGRSDASWGQWQRLHDELARLRSLRDGWKRLSQKASRVDVAIGLLNEMSDYPRANEIVEVVSVLKDDSWFYLNGTRHCARCGHAACIRQGGTRDCVEDSHAEV